MDVQYVDAVHVSKHQMVVAMEDAGRHLAPGCLHALMTTAATTAVTVATMPETARVAVAAGNLFNLRKW